MSNPVLKKDTLNSAIGKTLDEFYLSALSIHVDLSSFEMPPAQLSLQGMVRVPADLIAALTYTGPERTQD